MTHRIFDGISHARFADLSQDYNPIHMDVIAARRTQTGAPIVHGVHSLLWLLESISHAEPRLPRATSLKAQFRKPIYIGDECSFDVTQVTSKAMRARILVAGAEAVIGSIGFGDYRKTPRSRLATFAGVMMPPASPSNWHLDEMDGRAGCLSFGSTITDVQAMFPCTARQFGARQTAALVRTSSLVGMVMPGLHSLFLGLDVSFSDCDSDGDDVLHFEVVSVEPRFRLVRIGVHGGGLYGVLETMSRVPPVTQPAMASVLGRVASNEFRGSTALIIGGSRGLGELTAKLIAAGGGRVVITYANGKDDATAVAEEIRKRGAACETAAYDVRKDAAEQLAVLGVPFPTQVYYFATPLIYRRKVGIFDLGRFAEFNSYYVAGFFDLVQACLRRSPEGICVFYPSSVFVATRPAEMTEYAMSKAAAEILCADMQEYLPAVRVITRRLPRLPTDQTASTAAQGDAADPIEVILPIVREMYSMRTA